jgi:hypothetical protein
MTYHEAGRNELCPCGSGKKFKRCCYRKSSAEAAAPPVEYPIGTVAQYGPDDRTVTKIAAGVILFEDAEPIMQRWVATAITDSVKMQQELMEFFKEYGVTRVVSYPGVMGCPHEEGQDFPNGEDCPFCPFWKGKQGTARRN